MHGWIRAFAVMVFLLTSVLVPRSQTAPVPDSLSVRLEAHESRVSFLLGEPIVVDLVFAGRAPGYSVNASVYDYLPIPDLIEVTPMEGWSRSHAVVEEGANDLPRRLEGEPVRVPVLLNRTITFKRPGRYAVSISTDRLQWRRGAQVGEMRVKSNPLTIEVRTRNEAEEAGLVKRLYAQLRIKPELEKTNVDPETIEHLTVAEMDRLLTDIGDKDERASRARVEAAWQLAFLRSDDAVRAKVALIAADEETGSRDGTALQLVSGLPSSGDLKLQAQLLEEAWRDAKHLPTYVLEAALRQARELLKGPAVLDSQISVNVLQESEVRAREAEKTATIRNEEVVELRELAATLDQRSGANREKTICFLSGQGVAPDGTLRKAARCGIPAGAR